MNHLTHDEFVLSYYGEPDLGDARRAHLASCGQCGNELAQLAAVLDRVTPLEVPEPSDDYEARAWDRLQWRLRGERRKRPYFAWIALAATMAVAFIAGVLWKSSSRPADKPASIAATDTSSTARRPEDAKTPVPNRVLLVVVGEHFDQSERVLVELTNLTPNGNTDISATRDRAQELLESNRLYRTTATTRGEEDVATLLDELEPVLLQLAHAPAQVSDAELRAMQKRVEAKGLVFKLRVVRSDVNRDARAPQTSI
ncbi:MAG TPA: hypothetical protein VM733_09610 [Thermoanaerobaculia bacterium]|nr:hypothetical protein [Thermoanaerobaculia bacterium]